MILPGALWCARLMLGTLFTRYNRRGHVISQIPRAITLQFQCESRSECAVYYPIYSCADLIWENRFKSKF